MHPCTPEDFSDIILDKSTRYYTIKRLRETKKLRFTGFFQDGRGRPHDVYCNGWVPNKLAHEVKLTKLLLKFPFRMERGPEVDKVYRPDWTMFLPNGQVWHGEFDTGHQRGDQINRRWAVYEPLVRQCEAYRKYGGKLPPMVLVVTQRRELDRLLSRAQPYGAFMYFAFYNEIMEQPFGQVLRTVKGKLGAFPRPGN